MSIEEDDFPPPAIRTAQQLMFGVPMVASTEWPTSWSTGPHTSRQTRSGYQAKRSVSRAVPSALFRNPETIVGRAVLGRTGLRRLLSALQGHTPTPALHVRFGKNRLSSQNHSVTVLPQIADVRRARSKSPIVPNAEAIGPKMSV